MLGKLKSILPSNIGPGAAPVIIRPFGFVLFSTFNNRGESGKAEEDLDGFTGDLEIIVEALEADDLTRGRELATYLLARMQAASGRFE